MSTPASKSVSMDALSRSMEPLTQANYTAIKNELANNRNGAIYVIIVKVLRGTGLRLAEVMRLRGSDFATEGPNTFIWIVRGKRKAIWEKVAIQPDLAADIRSYMSMMKIGSGALWPIKQRMIQRKFAEASEAVLGYPANLHQLRHLFVSSLIDAGENPAVVSKLVGHSSLQTTMKWYYDLSSDKRAEIARSVPI